MTSTATSVAVTAETTLKADIDRLLSALESLKKGDQMVFTYVSGTGTTLAINGTEKLTIAGPAFGRYSHDKLRALAIDSFRSSGRLLA